MCGCLRSTPAWKTFEREPVRGPPVPKTAFVGLFGPQSVSNSVSVGPIATPNRLGAPSALAALSVPKSSANPSGAENHVQAMRRGYRQLRPRGWLTLDHRTQSSWPSRDRRLCAVLSDRSPVAPRPRALTESVD